MMPCRARALRRGRLRAERHLWRLPTAVAVTTALAQGGAFTGNQPPLGATPIDAITLATTVPAGGSVSFPIPAIAAGRVGGITALGIDTSDAAATTFTTRVGGVAVPPFSAEVGSPGPTSAPTPLGAPIALGPGQVFDLLVGNTSAVDITVSVRIQGFTF